MTYNVSSGTLDHTLYVCRSECVGLMSPSTHKRLLCRQVFPGNW